MCLSYWLVSDVVQRISAVQVLEVECSVCCVRLAEVQAQIEASFDYNVATAQHAFHTRNLPCPEFSTYKVDLQHESELG